IEPDAVPAGVAGVEMVGEHQDISSAVSGHGHVGRLDEAAEVSRIGWGLHTGVLEPLDEDAGVLLAPGGALLVAGEPHTPMRRLQAPVAAPTASADVVVVHQEERVMPDAPDEGRVDAEPGRLGDHGHAESTEGEVAVARDLGPGSVDEVESERPAVRL